MTQEERDEKLATLSIQIRDVHKALFGNGQPGVCARIDRVEERVIASDRRYDDCPARNRNWLIILGVAFSGLASCAAMATVALMLWSTVM
jgi:hypothetical protein